MAGHAVRINGVSSSALRAFAQASQRSGHDQLEIINWLLAVLELSTHCLIFRASRVAGVTAERIKLLPLVAEGDTSHCFSGELGQLALAGLARGRALFGCDDAGVLMRIAQLAPYFDHNDVALYYSPKPTEEQRVPLEKLKKLPG